MSYDSSMRSGFQRVGRVAVVILLGVLAFFHFSFALANFGFVESLPRDLNVLFEGLSALIAAGSLAWASRRQLEHRSWGHIVVGGGLAFLAGMSLSVATGASGPEMFQVVIPIIVVGLTAALLERTQKSRGAPNAIPAAE